MLLWAVVSNIFYFHPYLGKIPILTNIFQRGWNHQLVLFFRVFDQTHCKVTLRRDWSIAKKNIHGTGIFPLHLAMKNQANVGNYTSPMDGMGWGTKIQDVSMVRNGPCSPCGKWQVDWWKGEHWDCKKGRDTGIREPFSKPHESSLQHLSMKGSITWKFWWLDRANHQQTVGRFDSIWLSFWKVHYIAWMILPLNNFAW